MQKDIICSKLGLPLCLFLIFFLSKLEVVYVTLNFSSLKWRQQTNTYLWNGVDI